MGLLRRIRIDPADDVDARVTVKVGDGPVEHVTTHYAQLPDGTKVSVVLQGPADLGRYEINVDWSVRESAIHRAAVEQGRRLAIW